MYLLKSPKANFGNIFPNSYQKSGNGITLVTELHPLLPNSDLKFQYFKSVEHKISAVFVLIINYSSA